MTDEETRSGSTNRNSCGGRSRRRRHHHGRRKERVLHTRISEQLSDDIRRLADDMRVPVSNLVRNVLEEVFTTVENVSDDVGDFFEDVLDEAEGVRERIRNQREHARPGSRSSQRRRRSQSDEVESEFRADESSDSRPGWSGRRPSDAVVDATPAADDVLGWQPIVLSRAHQCPDCGAALAQKDRAYLGISGTGSPGRIVCEACSGAR